MGLYLQFGDLNVVNVIFVCRLFASLSCPLRCETIGTIGTIGTIVRNSALANEVRGVASVLRNSLVRQGLSFARPSMSFDL